MRGRGKKPNLQPGKMRSVSTYSIPDFKHIGSCEITASSPDGMSWDCSWKVPAKSRLEIRRQLDALKRDVFDNADCLKKDSWELECRFGQLSRLDKITTMAACRSADKSPENVQLFDTLLFSLSKLPITKSPSGIYPIIIAKDELRKAGGQLVRTNIKDGWWRWRLSSDDSFELLKRLHTKDVKGKLAVEMIGALETKLPLFQPIFDRHGDTILAKRLWSGMQALDSKPIALASGERHGAGMVEDIIKQCAKIYDKTQDEFWKHLPKSANQAVLVSSDKLPKVTSKFDW